MNGETPGPEIPQPSEREPQGSENSDRGQNQGAPCDLEQRKSEQEKSDKSQIEKIREKIEGFLNKGKKEAWEAMGERDELANITQRLEGQLEPDQTGFTVEVFVGSPRSEAVKGETEKTVVMTDNMEQAKGIHETLGKEQQVIIANPHAFPFQKGILDRIVDPHKGTHVGPKGPETLGSPWQSLQNLYAELKALMKEGRGEVGFLAARPEYVSEETHEAWRKKFGESLKERAAALSEKGKLIFSVGVRPEDWAEGSGYMAHVAQVGEVFLSPAEIKEVVKGAGLKIDTAYAGMGPRSQRMHVENAAKAVMMSITGWEFERFADEVGIPIAHSIINRLGTGKRESLEGLTPVEIKEKMKLEKVDIDHFEEARTSGLASALTPEGKPQPPDRVIIVASRGEG